MNCPENLLYTSDHEWIKVENDIATIGITDYAQGELGDIIFIEFPEIDEQFDREDVIGSIEAVKTVADIFVPVTGQILEINEALEDAPELINQDPYGDGWLVKIKLENSDETSDLLNPESYLELIK